MRPVCCVECRVTFQTKTRASCCPTCRPIRRRRQSDQSRLRISDAKRGLRPCDVCWAAIPPGRSKRCSPECAREAQRHRLLGWPVNACSLLVRSCDCGSAFIARRATGPGRRKCDVCSVPEADRLRAKRAARADAVRAGEVVRLSDVAARDGHRCQLCRQPVDPNTSHPHPKSASLDHIIPLSRGGEHTMANTQLAHLRCNMLKSDHPANEQLRLIG